MIRKYLHQIKVIMKAHKTLKEKKEARGSYRNENVK